MLGLTTSLICLIFAAAYIYLKKRYRYWKNLGIPGPQPKMVVGNIMNLFSLKSTEPLMMDEWYKQYRNEPYIGYYNFWRPSLLVIDPELIKAITEVDFNHFTDHPKIKSEAENDTVFDSLFTMKGARWKLKRQLFSKLFSPKRLRELSNILDRYNDTLMKEFDERLKTTDEIEVMEILEEHIMRTITSFMYGIEPEHNRERFSKLSELSEIFARPSTPIVLRFLLFTVFPDLYSKLGISTFNNVFWNYISGFTNDLLHSRNQTKVDNDDLVTIIGKMQKEGLLESEKIDHREASGHVFTFFLAGHHTTKTMLCHTIYQLSLYPEIQDKLRTEVDSVLNGKDAITYDSINQMNYLEAIINETLRMIPLVGVIKRTCTQPYKIDEKFTIPKGMDIMLPAYSFQTDPQYFPEPEKFIPERFSDIDKPPALFMPFGRGPRLCIGKRFAYISMKTVIAKLVSEYIILPGTKTRMPLRFDPKTIAITAHPVDGLHIRLQKRK